MTGFRSASLAGGVALVVALAWSRAAHADSIEARACFYAHVAAQRLRNEQHLIEATSELMRCSRASCPSVTIGECGQWLRDVEREMPSIVFEAHDAEGADVLEFRATLDGSPIKLPPLGHPLEVDPGPKRFRFERPGFKPVEQTVVLSSGDQKRRLVFTFQPVLEPVPAGEQNRPVPPSVYVLGATGLAAAGVSLGFGLYGFSGLSGLDACKPDCSDDQVSEVRRRFVGADIAGALAIGAVTIAAVLFFTRPSTPASNRAKTALLHRIRIPIGPSLTFDL